MISFYDMLDFSRNWALGIATVVELGDATRNHLEVVGIWSAELAKRIGMDEVDAGWLGVAATLHDVGKGAIPRELWLKNGPFLDQEREYIKAHTEFGVTMLERIEDFGRAFVPVALLKKAQEIAQYHHENWDGSGYPRGLSGDNIPLSARIVKIADVADALLSKRPYKPAWSLADTERELREKSGSEFDPHLVAHFLKGGLESWLELSSCSSRAR